MDYPRIIQSNQKEEYISIQRVNNQRVNVFLLSNHTDSCESQ